MQIKGCRLCKDNTKDGVGELTEYDALTETLKMINLAQYVQCHPGKN